MCRLLAIKAGEPVGVNDHLDAFARIARDSREYQGHGWGCAWRAERKWKIYKNIRPIWEDARPSIPPTTVFLAHARSAFRNEGIRVENNMPFSDGANVFIFNGELRGVRIREEGRIGAEKVFNFVKRFQDDGWPAALRKGTGILERRSEYVRAMNIIVSDGDRVFAYSRFAEDPDYFTLRRRRGAHGDPAAICSMPLPTMDGWESIGNGDVCQFP